MENTRRFREDVPYALPKDLEEGQRLNFQHYIIHSVLRGNHAVPLDQESMLSPQSLNTIFYLFSTTFSALFYPKQQLPQMLLRNAIYRFWRKYI